MTSVVARPPVHVTPAGILAWLTQANRSPERDLIEHFLLCGAEGTPDVRALAKQLGRQTAELARVLFQLNRQQAVLVGGRAAAPHRFGLADLQTNLNALVGDQGRVVVADRDGLCIAACGWVASAVDHAAVQAANGDWSAEMGTRLWFARGKVTLAAAGPLNRDAAAWVWIARCLLVACGPLATHEGAV